MQESSTSHIIVEPKQFLLLGLVREAQIVPSKAHVEILAGMTIFEMTSYELQRQPADDSWSGFK